MIQLDPAFETDCDGCCVRKAVVSIFVGEALGHRRVSRTYLCKPCLQRLFELIEPEDYDVSRETEDGQ